MIESGFSYAKVMGPKGQYIDIVLVQPLFYKEGIAEWARDQPQEMVVVEQGTTGVVRIYANRDIGCALTSIVQKLRWEEQKKRHDKQKITDWQDLSADGVVAYWSYSQKESIIAIGEPPATNGTQLALHEVYKIVCSYLYPRCSSET